MIGKKEDSDIFWVVAHLQIITKPLEVVKQSLSLAPNLKVQDEAVKYHVQSIWGASPTQSSQSRDHDFSWVRWQTSNPHYLTGWKGKIPGGRPKKTPHRTRKISPTQLNQLVQRPMPHRKPRGRRLFGHTFGGSHICCPPWMLGASSDRA